MSESEKITINMSPVDLGKVDWLVDQGHYANRTDFIRTAIRSQLDKHTDDVQRAATSFSYLIGVASYGKSSLERLKSKGKKLNLTVIGALHLADDITPGLARETIESVKVHGVLRASDEVKAVLAKKML